jgi:signal transduction histidine kinase
MTLMLFDSSDTGNANKDRYKRCNTLSVNEVALECVQTTQMLYNIETISFETTLSDSVRIKTNRLFLTRTLMELLHNSVKFTDGQHISLQVTETDETVRFIVEHVGPGMPHVTEQLVFIPFSKVNNFSKGLGLGLPLCKSHMTGLGGTIVYDADYKQGCRFIIDLPKN